MTRLQPTGGDPDEEYLTELEIRRLAAEVPRYGEQVHPDPDGESVGPEFDDPGGEEQVRHQTLPRDRRRS